MQIFRSEYLCYFSFAQLRLSSELSINTFWNISLLRCELSKPGCWSGISRSQLEKGAAHQARSGSHADFTDTQESVLRFHSSWTPPNRYIRTKEELAVCRIKCPKQTELLSCPSGAIHTCRKLYCYFCLPPAITIQSTPSSSLRS